MLACCRPKLYWMPKNPRFMLRSCHSVRIGFLRDIMGS